MNGSRRAAGQLSSLPSNWIDELFDDVVLYWTFSSHLIISALFKHQIYAQIKQFSFFFWKLFKIFFHFQIFYEIVHQVRTRFCWNWQIIFFLFGKFGFGPLAALSSKSRPAPQPQKESNSRVMHFVRVKHLTRTCTLCLCPHSPAEFCHRHQAP